ATPSPGSFSSPMSFPKKQRRLAWLRDLRNAAACYRHCMLRPKSGLLGSSRAERRANVRAERRRAFGHAAKGTFSLVAGLGGAVLELVLLWGMPLAYLAAS